MGARCRAVSLLGYQTPPPSANHCKDIEPHVLGTLGPGRRQGGKPATHPAPSHEVYGVRKAGRVCSGTLGSSRVRRRGLYWQPLYFNGQQNLRESGAVSLWWELTTRPAASLGLGFRKSAGRSQREGAGLQKTARSRQRSVRPRLGGRPPAERGSHAGGRQWQSKTRQAGPRWPG